MSASPRARSSHEPSLTDERPRKRTREESDGVGYGGDDASTSVSNHVAGAPDRQSAEIVNSSSAYAPRYGSTTSTAGGNGVATSSSASAASTPKYASSTPPAAVSTTTTSHPASAQQRTHPHPIQQQQQTPSRYDRNKPITKDTLEHSFFLLEPHDEFTREVGDWIWGWCCNRANVEIEAKIGMLVDNRPGLPPKTRVTFPLAIETILTDTSFARFESNMSLRQHHHFNQILNMRATEAAAPSYTGAPIRYVHTKEIDSFYPSYTDSKENRTKIRVTRDENTGQLKGDGKPCIQKSRVADMNIYSPKRGFDFRISISVEEPVPMPTTKAMHSRWKNRVSYQHQAFTIDLTQVKGKDAKEVLHELEVEFSDMPLLMREGQKMARGEESIYYDLVQVFLNNIRMLIRNGIPP